MASLIKEGLTKEWQRGWQREARGRHFFSVQPKVRKIWLCYSLTCWDSVKLCRLRLGHYGLSKSLCIIGKHVSGLCECEILETVKLVFLECRKYREERKVFFVRLTGLGVEAFSVAFFFGH